MRSERVLNIFRILVFALVFLCAVPVMQGNGSAEERGTSAPAEYEVKAAFVYNFIKFVEWPDAGGPPGDSIRLCILGELPDAAAFANLGRRQVRGKRMTVLTLDRPGEASGCDVLFVAANQTGRLREIIESLEDRPTLTIGDTEGYARRGVMINMFLENKRIRFEINEKKARAAGLRISAKLLKLASKVYGSTMNEEK